MSIESKIATSSGVDTNIGIEASRREGIAKVLSSILADEHVLYIKLRNFHWNVEGIHFQQLHAFFEEQYDAIAGYIDEIAERIRAIGHYAPGSMGEFATLARLDEASHFDGNAQKMLSAILEDNESIIQSLRLDQDKVLEVYNDVGTQDFLVGLMQEHEKMAWMLRAHLA